jgi:NAD(P)-dependent dehydrogenase (short-subunit alcohol dehydrogenase family)
MKVSKAVLITGGSSGIGWATAERLVDMGWRVYATARNVQKIAPLEQRCCELSSTGEVEHAHRGEHVSRSRRWLRSGRSHSPLVSQTRAVCGQP